MASSKDQVICHVCGFKNAPSTERCVSCGAKLEELTGSYTLEEQARRTGRQDGFDIKWALISVLIYIVLQGGVLAALPQVIEQYDPQGFSALMISFGVWFVGGILIGLLSTRKTFLEPLAGALIAVVPTIWWIVASTPPAPENEDLGGGFQLTLAAYIIGGLLGAMLSLFGAFMGEKLQDMFRG